MILKDFLGSNGIPILYTFGFSEELCCDMARPMWSGNPGQTKWSALLMMCLHMPYITFMIYRYMMQGSGVDH